jgi:hypothetical protein
VGVVIVVRRGGAREEKPMGWPRYIGASLAAGLAAGVLAAGAGGRLVMRLLGATSEDVHGSLTEAGETVGEITVDGTLALFLFAGVPAGLLSGALCAMVGPLLPPGRVRGLALGLLLLVLFGTTIDPLRADSVDFLLLEPAWLAVLAFSLLAQFQGMLVAALAPVRSAPASRIATAGRIAVAVVALAALPGFVGATADILSSG